MDLGLGINFDLTVIWAGIIVFAIFVYVVLDGFDLGLGMLFLVEPEKANRDVMMNSVAPVWDGNETWLVLGGGGLFAAFPLAYALVLPALYAPLIAMLLALIFRGVAFEFRWKTTRWRGVWDIAFIGGSAVATFAQGIALGALLQGIEVDLETRSYSGGWWDWLTPFSITTGVALMAGYCLLGATWLIMKTDGPLQDRMRRWAWVLGIITVAFIGIVSLWTPFLQDGYYNRWFTGWGVPLAGTIALSVLLITWWMFRSINVHRHEYRPFLQALSLFALCFVGLAICLWPYIVPIEVTIWQAAAPEKSQVFMLIGAVILVPLILAYTAYAYWTFRGKVDPEESYH